MKNKQIINGLVFGIIILFVGSGIASTNRGIFRIDVAKDMKSVKTETVANWTYMAYWVGDLTINTPEGWNLPGDIGILHIMNRMELSGSTSEVNIVIQADDYNIWGGDQNAFGGTRRYHIQHDDNINELANYTLNETVWYLEEQNMGDPQTLIDFVNWTILNYPAEHYVLILFSHGAGWIGMCQDESSSKIWGPDSYINISELKSVLSSNIRPDILFTWGCHMGQLEVFYELKECAHIILAGESTMIGSPNMIEVTLKELTSNPEITPIELAQLFVDTYNVEGDSTYLLTLKIDNDDKGGLPIFGKCPLFGIQSSDTDTITAAVNNFAEAIITQYHSNPLRIRLMLDLAFKSSTMVLQLNKVRQTDFLAHELYVFSEKISVLAKNRMLDIYTAARYVLSAIDNSSLIKPSENQNENFHGISIYSPTQRIIYRLTQYGLYTINYTFADFAKDTKWDELLDLYYFGHD